MHVFNEQSNTKMIVAVELGLLMKFAISCFAISLVEYHEMQLLKSNELPKTNRR